VQTDSFCVYATKGGIEPGFWLKIPCWWDSGPLITIPSWGVVNSSSQMSTQHLLNNDSMALFYSVLFIIHTEMCMKAHLNAQLTELSQQSEYTTYSSSQNAGQETDDY
jgi:hypothetical protein